MNAMVAKHLVAANATTMILSDPTDEVLNNINQIMFRGGVLAAATW